MGFTPSYRWNIMEYPQLCIYIYISHQVEVSKWVVPVTKCLYHVLPIFSFDLVNGRKWFISSIDGISISPVYIYIYMCVCEA